jgi:hypothetical protein
MTQEEIPNLSHEMLREFSSFSTTFGGIEFYGYSTAFRDLFQICRRLASTEDNEMPALRKVYLFLEQYHGKSSISKALEIEAKANGFDAFRFDGTAGITQKELKDLQNRADTFVIVDELPDAAVGRRTVLERFNALSGIGILFASPVYETDANLDSTFLRMTLSHVDQRPIDKISWLVGLIRENLRDQAEAMSRSLNDALTQLPFRALATFFQAPLGDRVRRLPDLASRISEALRLQIELRPGEAYPQEELAVIFIRFYSPSSPQGGHGFRLWVEGDSDCQILRIVSRLAKQSIGADLEEGLAIHPLGEDREGGTSKILEVVLSEQTQRNKDLFLFDFDGPGRHAQEEMKVLQQDAMLLEPKLSCSRSNSEVEIEDFIALTCLDRFYEAHLDLRPEREIIRYKSPPARRLVIDGGHKDSLVRWLDQFASLEDVENLFFILCDIRSRFSLKNSLSSGEMRDWKQKLEDEFSVRKHLGARPKHWSQ